jgi:hypothetical protein
MINKCTDYSRQVNQLALNYDTPPIPQFLFATHGFSITAPRPLQILISRRTCLRMHPYANKFARTRVQVGKSSRIYGELIKGPPGIGLSSCTGANSVDVRTLEPLPPPLAPLSGEKMRKEVGLPSASVWRE